jgi:hypothetical protein
MNELSYKRGLKILVLSGISAGCGIPGSEVTQMHHNALETKQGSQQVRDGVLSPPITDF